MKDEYAIPKQIIAAWAVFCDRYHLNPDLTVQAGIPKELPPSMLAEQDRGLRNIDDLMGYIQQICPIPVTQGIKVIQEEVDQVKEMLMCGSDSIVENILKIPPVYLTQLLPVAIMRTILRDVDIPFDHTKSKTFDQFFEDYNRVVLN